MYYSIKDIARLLGCDPETIRRRIRDKKLKAIKVNNQFKVKEEDLIEMLKEKIIGVDLSEKTFEEILKFV